MSKKVFIFLLCTFSFVFFSCSDLMKQNKSVQRDIAEKEAAKPKVINSTTITISFSTNAEDPRVLSLKMFKEIVERQTENRIKINILGDGKLEKNGKSYSDAELIQNVISGNLDMTISSAGIYASYIPKAGFSALPYLFSNYDEAWDFFDGDMLSSIDSDFNDCNMVVLCYFDNGFRCITTSKNFGPINKLSDLKGLVIRTPQNQIVMETMLALGASPRSSSFATLKQDIIDGKFEAQENPLQVIYSSKLYEVQKYLAITNHSYDAVPVTIRKDLWDSFSTLDKLIIQDAATQAQDYNRKLTEQQTADYIKLLQEKGMIVTYPDLKEFSAATNDVIDVFSSVYGSDLVSKVKINR